MSARDWRAALGATALLAVAALNGGSGALAAAPTVPGAGFGWGADQYGQLGPRVNGTVLTPVAVPLPTGTTQIALGRDFSLVLAGGVVYTWGRNDRGQLGDGTHLARTEPAVIGLTGIVALAADEQHAAAVSSSGQVFTWGANDFGQIGDGTTDDRDTPTLVQGVSNATAVGTGSTHTVAVTSSGAVLGWGSDSNGQLGLGSGHAAPLRTPQLVSLPAGIRVTAVAAGYRHTVALTSDHRVLTWGGDDSGQLGRGLPGADDPTPGLVALPAGTTVVAVAAGSAHTEVITSAGGALAWGANDHGQLGDGSTTQRPSPVAVHLPSGSAIAALSVAQSSTLALSSGGTRLLTWGAGANGQIGTGSRQDAVDPVTVPAAATPVPVTAAQIYTAVGAGYFFDLAAARSGPPATLLMTPRSVSGRVGRAQPFAVEAYDAAGNDVGPRPDAALSMTGGGCAGLACTATATGRQIVTGRSDGLSGTSVFDIVAAASGGRSPTGPARGGAGAASAPSGSGPAPRATGGARPAFTGVQIALLCSVGAAALLGGAVLSALVRRRRATEEQS